MLSPADVEQARPHPPRGAPRVALPALRGEAPGRGRARLRRPAAPRGAAARDGAGGARAGTARVWSHVLVDEYQDTNRAQYRIVQLLTEEHRNLCVVGDPDQSVYRWRGADLRNILDFEKDFPDCRVVALEQNYRSTKRILDIASAVIVNNTARKDKRLWTENGEGERAEVYRAWDENEEAAFVAQTIRAPARRGARLPRRRGVLPHQRAVPRAGGRAAPREHPVPDRGRRALLRAARDQGHGRLPAPDRRTRSTTSPSAGRWRRPRAASARPRSTAWPTRPGRAGVPLLMACATLPADITGKPRRALEEFARLIARLGRAARGA